MRECEELSGRVESHPDERDSWGEGSRDRLVGGGARQEVSDRVNSDKEREGGELQVADVMKAGSGPHNELSM